MPHYIITAPLKYDETGAEKTTCRRVGAAFENTERDTGETFLTLRLDFPVDATELAAFQPSNRDVTEQEPSRPPQGDRFLQRGLPPLPRRFSRKDEGRIFLEDMTIV